MRNGNPPTLQCMLMPSASRPPNPLQIRPARVHHACASQAVPRNMHSMYTCTLSPSVLHPCMHAWLHPGPYLFNVSAEKDGIMLMPFGQCCYAVPAAGQERSGVRLCHLLSCAKHGTGSECTRGRGSGKNSLLADIARCFNVAATDAACMQPWRRNANNMHALTAHAITPISRWCFSSSRACRVWPDSLRANSRRQHLPNHHVHTHSSMPVCRLVQHPCVLLTLHVFPHALFGWLPLLLAGQWAGHQQHYPHTHQHSLQRCLATGHSAHAPHWHHALAFSFAHASGCRLC